MNKSVSGLLAVALSMFLTPGFAQSAGIADDLGIEISGDVGYYTQYVWRGIVLDRDQVLQPGFYVSTPDKGFGKLTAKIWSSHDLENKDTLKSEENDYILDYTYALPAGFAVSVGHTYYDFTGTNTHSKEFYAGLTLPTVNCPTVGAIKGATLCPSLYVYRDYGRPADGGGEGTYTVLTLGLAIPVTMGKYGCSLDLSGHYGANHELFINGDGADALLTAGFTVPLTVHCSISPTMNYSMPFGDLKNSNDGNQKERFYYGFTGKYKF